jgi:hypothetical protein
MHILYIPVVHFHGSLQIYSVRTPPFHSQTSLSLISTGLSHQRWHTLFLISVIKEISTGSMTQEPVVNFHRENCTNPDLKRLLSITHNQ